MANLDRPRGFRPEGRVKQAIKMQAGGDVYAGEFLTLANDGQVDAAAAGADIIGLALHKAASGEDVLVSVDPAQIYVGQADGSDIDAQTDIGNLCDIVATAEDSTYGIARQEIDSSTIGTGSGGQLVIIGVQVRPDNAAGAQADVRVKINENQAFGETDFAGV